MDSDMSDIDKCWEELVRFLNVIRFIEWYGKKFGVGIE
jgi:hypothetical protein